jgi:hypothetical protein
MHSLSRQDENQRLFTCTDNTRENFSGILIFSESLGNLNILPKKKKNDCKSEQIHTSWRRDCWNDITWCCFMDWRISIVNIFLSCVGNGDSLVIFTKDVGFNMFNLNALLPTLYTTYLYICWSIKEKKNRYVNYVSLIFISKQGGISQGK